MEQEKGCHAVIQHGLHNRIVMGGGMGGRKSLSQIVVKITKIYLFDVSYVLKKKRQKKEGEKA